MEEDELCDEDARYCERCQVKSKEVELIPMMGYSEYLCRECAAAVYRSGYAV